MDTYLAIASKRDVKHYAEQAVPDDLTRRILDAGRLAGSARNRQPWRFVVVRDEAVRNGLAATVYVPANVLGAALVVALLASADGDSGFDCGRAAQNMMLAAWNEGVASSPNGHRDRARAAEVLEAEAGWMPQGVLTFGYAARGSGPESRPAAEWSDRANRLPFEEVTSSL